MMAQDKKPVRRPRGAPAILAPTGVKTPATPQEIVAALVEAAPVPPAPIPADTAHAVTPPEAQQVEIPAIEPAPAPQPVSAPAPTPPAPAAPSQDAAAADHVVEPISQGTEDMATAADTITSTAADATSKAQTYFADAQGKTKSALEKGAKFYEELGDFAKGNMEALVASSKVTASGVEALGQDAVAYGRKSFEQATAAFKSFAAVKSPTELFQLQSEFVRGAFDQLVAESAKTTEKLTKLAGDAAQPLSSRFALAAEKVKSTSL